jgi:hypothetical protein
MHLTGSSYTAVNRRVAEGRAALRRHLADNDSARHYRHVSTDGLRPLAPVYVSLRV